MRKEKTISFVMPVCPSVCPHWTHWFPLDWFSWNLSISRKAVEKIEFSLKSDKNDRYFVWIPIYLYDSISRNFSFKKEKYLRQTLYVQKKTFLCSVTLPDNLAVYDMWKNMVDSDRLQMKIRLMHFAYWITKATNTHPEYVVLIALPRQQCLRERASILSFRCTYAACLVKVIIIFRYT